MSQRVGEKSWEKARRPERCQIGPRGSASPRPNRAGVGQARVVGGSAGLARPTTTCMAGETHCPQGAAAWKSHKCLRNARQGGEPRCAAPRIDSRARRPRWRPAGRPARIGGHARERENAPRRMVPMARRESAARGQQVARRDVQLGKKRAAPRTFGENEGCGRAKKKIDALSGNFGLYLLRAVDPLRGSRLVQCIARCSLHRLCKENAQKDGAGARIQDLSFSEPIFALSPRGCPEMRRPD